MITIKFYPANFQIWKDGQHKEFSFDGLKGELTWEEWKEDFKDYSQEEQEEIKDSMRTHEILKSNTLLTADDIDRLEMNNCDSITIHFKESEYNYTYEINSDFSWEEHKRVIAEVLSDELKISIDEDSFEMIRNKFNLFGLI